jgi:hypothetical protein
LRDTIATVIEDLPMLDIRPELRERLKRTQDRREKLRQELAELDTNDEGLRTVLESETAIWNKLSPPQLILPQPDIPANGNNGAGTLPELLQELLANRAQTMEELKTELTRREYPFGEKSPGRVVNFALVNLQNHGVARKREDDSWELVEGGRPIN